MQMFEILENFKIDGTIVHAERYGNGHINKTYLITTTQNERFIVQQINTNVFKNPTDVMHNIELVTSHLRKRNGIEKEDPDRGALEIIRTLQNKTYFKLQDRYWRCYRFIEGAKTYEKITSPNQFYEVGTAVGKFQKYLCDFPIDELKITIPDFHNTPKRFEDFLKIASKDKMHRGMDVFNEIKFVFDRQNDIKTIMKLLDNEQIPLRVTHNDTKLNNVMLDEKTDKAICIIDLDTVMPGSVLFDFGDAIRVGASTAVEDEEDLNKVELDLSLFKEFSQGFLEVMHEDLTDLEKENLVTSTKIITMECGMRFLTDYLDGDKYFNIEKPDHNLIRARTQFKLVSEIESKESEMEKIINEILTHLKTT